MCQCAEAAPSFAIIHKLMSATFFDVDEYFNEKIIHHIWQLIMNYLSLKLPIKRIY
jgi:hypothetical protein